VSDGFSFPFSRNLVHQCPLGGRNRNRMLFFSPFFLIIFWFSGWCPFPPVRSSLPALFPVSFFPKTLAPLCALFNPHFLLYRTRPSWILFPRFQTRCRVYLDVIFPNWKNPPVFPLDGVPFGHTVVFFDSSSPPWNCFPPFRTLIRSEFYDNWFLPVINFLVLGEELTSRKIFSDPPSLLCVAKVFFDPARMNSLSYFSGFFNISRGYH